MRPASPQERERLLDDFIRLCEIESPSGRERNVAEAVGGSPLFGVSLWHRPSSRPDSYGPPEDEADGNDPGGDNGDRDSAIRRSS